MIGEEEAEGSKIVESIRIRRFDGLPSSQQFQSHIEPTNAPAVFRGAVKDWEAFAKWNPRSNGLQYLKEKLGFIVVEAMLSKSGSIFYGDLRSHERVPIPFSTFITSCEACLNADSKLNFDVDAHLAMTPYHHEEHPSQSAIDADKLGQLYLAQVPIFNTEYGEMASLNSLQDDFQTPAILEMKQLVSINFWMNACQSRSSTHYDPHHNLLCVVAGRKQVDLWPPMASPSLYPMAVHGEASNHSAVDILNPDLRLHPRFKHSADYIQKVTLSAGDALFLPEGWFHQVDSADLTIAINFWWQSDMMSKMSEHMDSYYLRRIVNRLVGKEVDLMVHWSSSSRPIDSKSFLVSETSEGATSNTSNVSEANQNGSETPSLDNTEPSTVQALHELVSIVHGQVNSGQVFALEASTSSKVQLEGEQESNSRADTSKIFFSADSYRLENDPLAMLLWSLKPLVLHKVLLSLVNIFPRTLEALILHLLSPMAAEILTRKFDEMDHLTTKDQRDQFYKAFYSVFQDQFAAMDSLLNGKELLAFQALRNVMDQHLGCQIGRPKQLDDIPFDRVNKSMPAHESSE